jgi:hypothetical protein
MLLQLRETLILMGNQWDINREEGNNRIPKEYHQGIRESIGIIQSIFKPMQ